MTSDFVDINRKLPCCHRLRMKGLYQLRTLQAGCEALSPAYSMCISKNDDVAATDDTWISSVLVVMGWTCAHQPGKTALGLVRHCRV